jgi:hypothetical protein
VITMKTPTNKRLHPKKPPLFLDELHTDRVQLLRYDVRDLSKALVLNAGVPLLQKLDQDKYNFLTSELPDHGSDRRILRYLKRYMAVFDDAFFFGRLREHVKLKFGRASIILNLTMTRHVSAYTAGRGLPFLPRSPTRMGRMQIKIVKMAPGRCNFKEIMRKYLMLLVHEMIHAFLDIYGCNCLRYCFKRRLKPNVRLGKTGHGTAWVNAAAAIQPILMTYFGRNQYMIIGDSIRYEMNKSGWKPTEKKLAKWEVVVPEEDNESEDSSEYDISSIEDDESDSD